MTLPNTTLGLLLAVMITLAGCSVSLDDGGGVEVSEPDSDASPTTDASSGTESPTTTTDQQDSAADSPPSDETDEDTATGTKTQTDPSAQTIDDSDTDSDSDSESTTDTPADSDESTTDTASDDSETETERPSDSPPVDDEVDSFTTHCGDTTFRVAEIGQRIDGDANETVIHYEVTNIGNTTAANVTLLLQGEMPLGVVEETVSLGTIEPGETVSGTEAIAGTHDDGEGGPQSISCESSSKQDSDSDSNDSTNNETESSGDDQPPSVETRCSGGTVRVTEAAQFVDDNRTYLDYTVFNEGNSTVEDITVTFVAENSDGTVTKTETVNQIGPEATQVGTVTFDGEYDPDEASPSAIGCGTSNEEQSDDGSSGSTDNETESSGNYAEMELDAPGFGSSPLTLSN